jgi:DNA-binding MarR family transcriptional regulator
VKHQRDESGHWLAGLSEPMLAMRAFLTANDELQRRQARRMGINATDMQALRLLDVDGPLGPTELARRLDLRSASVTVLLDRLEAAGHLERIRDGHDRRRVTVRVLPHAAEMLFDTWAPVIRKMDDVGHGLTSAQTRAVCSFFEDLTAVIEGTAAAGSAAD